MASKDVSVPTNDPLALWDNIPGVVEEIESDMGREVDFTTEPVFIGVYTGIHKTVSIPDNASEDNPNGTSELYSFTGAEGEPRSVWGTYQINSVMRGETGYDPIAPGDAILIAFKEKRTSGKRMVNIFEIKVKRVS